MRRLNIFLLFLMLSVSLSAQFVNNGATVTIQSGATLRVETDFINTSGTVTNNGTLEVQNNFTNSGTFTSASGSTVKFIGTANSNVTSGGATFQNVSMEKTNQNITLMSPMAVAGTLTFTNDNNKVILGTHNLTINAGGSIASADENEYVVTNSSGQLIKGLTANGTITHEIGDAAKYSPLSSVVTGSAYSSATLGARVVDAVHPSKPADADSYLSRYWVVNASGITTDYANTMTGTYALTGDANGTTNDIKGATYHTADWHYNGSAANTGTPSVTASTTTASVDLSGQNFFGRANLKAYLQGAYSGGTMTTLLNSTTPANNILEQFALTSPYADASASVSAGFFLANPTIVDWVKLEFRDPATPSTPSSNKISAFIKNNGDIVGLDGTSLPVVKNALPTSVIVLSHRNHLPIRTVNAGLSLIDPAQHDFSTGLGQAYDDNNIMTNESMLDLGGGVFGLYRANVNGNNVLNVLDLTLAKAGTNPSQSNVYVSSDVNLNGSANVLDLSQVKTTTNPSKSAHL